MPIHGYPGGVITANPVAPTSTVATGVWTTEQQLQAKSAGNWPFTIPTQQISRSLRFNSADSAYLNRTFSTPTAGTKWTWSGWVKRSALYATKNYQTIFGTQGAGAQGAIGFGQNGSDEISFKYSGFFRRFSTGLFRDVSAWYHIVVVIDTTQATEANRALLYVNGQTFPWTTSTSITQNDTTQINQNVVHNLGSNSGAGANEYYSGYLAEINFVDGQALTPSSFGQINASTGVWEPIAYTGTYGTNGFYLNFSDNSGTTSTTLGKDSSGNGNNWTPNNFSVTAGSGNDSLVDSPTSYGTDTGVGGEVRGNYCTLNPLWKSSRITLSNGNLDFVQNTGNYHSSAIGTLAVTDKVYFECTVPSVTANGRVTIAITNNNLTQANLDDESYFTVAGNYGVVFNKSGAGVNSTRYFNGSTESNASYTWSNNDVLKIAVDISAGNIWLGYNNTWIGGGNPASGTSPTYSGLSSTSLWQVRVSATEGTTASQGVVNFGQRAFAYTAPSGFKALCTQNLPTPTIGATSTTQADNYFNVVTRTFTAATAVITGLGFSPDWLWFKRRNTAASHSLYDRLRGTNARLLTNGTNAEITTTSAELTSFDSDGFTIGSDPGSISINSSNGDTGVVWCWRANGAGSTNTAGNITSTVSVSTASGFSIVTYTGNGSANQTVGHGLGVAPAFGILKDRDTNSNNDQWQIFHTAAGDKYGYFTTAAFAGTAEYYPTSGSSTTVTVARTGGVIATTNESGDRFVMYLFTPVAGYSAFGSYTGNGSADGPFVYTGFRPRYVMIKRTDSTSDWTIYDTSRSTYNQMNLALYANLSNAEGTTIIVIDTVSNGIKIRNSNADTNASGGTYIYACFAESPFKYALAR